MGLQTGRGFWYPEGDDPITDYPALAALLAAEVEDEFDQARAVSARYNGAFNNAAFTYMTLASNIVEKMHPAGGGFGPGSNAWFTCPDAGEYEISMFALWSGATGTGSHGLRCDRYNPAGTVLQEWISGASSDKLNGWLSCHGIVLAGALDRIYFGGFNAATGAAGSMLVRCGVRKI